MILQGYLNLEAELSFEFIEKLITFGQLKDNISTNKDRNNNSSNEILI